MSQEDKKTKRKKYKAEEWAPICSADALYEIGEYAPRLLIYLINAMFKLDIPADENMTDCGSSMKRCAKYTSMKSEYLIGNRSYRIDVRTAVDDDTPQETIDWCMHTVMRDSFNALGENHSNKIYFPCAGIICMLPDTKNQDNIEFSIEGFDGGKTADINIPVINVSKLTSDELFEKKLYILLPYYIFRYEKELRDTDVSAERIEAIKQELTSLAERFARLHEQSLITKDEVICICSSMVSTIRKNSDYMSAAWEDLADTLFMNIKEIIREVSRNIGYKTGCKIGRANVFRDMVEAGELDRLKAEELFGESYEKIKEWASYSNEEASSGE